MLSRPIRVLELRSVRGTGGGPEKTILQGTRRTDPNRFAITVCYLRDRRDDAFGVTGCAGGLGIDYVEVEERHSLDPAAWMAVKRLVEERRIDLVHAHDYKTNVFAWLIWHATGVLPLSTAHGWTGHSGRERWLYYPCEKRVLARFPRIVAVSTDIKNELVRHGARPERITTILNGIDHERFQRKAALEAAAREALGLQPDEFVVGAVGRLEPQKRFDILLRAVATLRTETRRLRVVIAGDGSQRDSLRRIAHDLQLDSTCIFTGHSADVAGLHHAFDLFVQSSDYEGTPNAVLEAMAFETPIVATDVGGTRELVEDGVHGVILPPGDADLLARAIRGAVADPAGMARRAAAARQRVEHDLSFDTRMRRLETVYDELIGVAALPPTLAERSCV